MELVPEPDVDTVKANERSGNRKELPELSSEYLPVKEQPAEQLVTEWSDKESPRDKSTIKQAAALRPGWRSEWRSGWSLQNIDPVFYVTLFLVSGLLVIGFYIFTAYNNRLVAAHLSEIEISNKLISEEIARSELVVVEQPPVTRTPAITHTPPELLQVKSQTVHGTGSGQESADEPKIDPVQTQEVVELRRLLSETIQQMEFLALENHELRERIEFGEAESGGNLDHEKPEVPELNDTEDFKITSIQTDPPPSRLPPDISQLQVQVVTDVSDLIASAEKAFKGRDYDAAADFYSLALQRNPWNRAANLGVASLAVLSGNRELAIDRYRHLLNLNPDDQSAFGALLDLATKESLVETELLSHISRVSTDQAIFYSMLGSHFGRESRWKEANAAFIHALQSSATRTSADILFNLAVSYEHLGLTAEAAAYYEQALNVGSSINVDRVLVQSRLNELLSKKPTRQ